MVSGAAWDRRPGETEVQFRHFLDYLHTQRSERSRYLRTRGGRERSTAAANDWRARAAAFDDQADRDYEQHAAEHIREVRSYHARIGRQLLEVAVARIDLVAKWNPADLVKLADLARKMELAAVLGTERTMGVASRTTVAAFGGDPDEWDRLAADLAGTMPQQ
jgi:hypothetical protein